MYRAVAWTARQQGVPLDNEAAVADLAARVELSMAAGGVIVNGVDVTRAIRTPEMDQAAAAVARMPRVRAVLVIGNVRRATGGVVMEGRTSGPWCSRCRREDLSRCLARGACAPPCRGPGPRRNARALADVATALAARDQSDQTRAASPLTIAPDAILVDTTGVPVEDGRGERCCDCQAEHGCVTIADSRICGLRIRGSVQIHANPKSAESTIRPKISNNGFEVLR